MIRGTVNAYRDAVVRIGIRRPGGPVAVVDAVVDTGYTGQLSLPIETVRSLGLVRKAGGTARMADDSVYTFENYAAEVEMADGWRPILVSIIGGSQLLGMKLMAGHKLEVAVVPGGAVTIRPLN